MAMRGYIIVWVGRDCDSGVWDAYPCITQGVFLKKEDAQKKIDEFNKEDPPHYDKDADETTGYDWREIIIHH